MSLPRLLNAIAELADLPALVAELGHEPLWEELPPGPDAVRAATVGRHGRFHWIGTETDQPVESVMDRIAQRLVRYGNASGVLVVYPAGRQLGIALGVGPVSGLVLNLDAPAPVALASLRRLRGLPAGSATAFAARAADVLAGRGVGHEFFRQFRSSLDQMAGAITGRNLRDASHRRALALLQLTRVLFLYFIQSRGWLDGRPDFLRRLLDEGLTSRRSVQRHLFDPLFFGTLNRPRPERSAGVRGFGAIPFLNGGLFEPHPLERRYRPLTPDAVWRDVVDQLFERYHFAASEEDASGGPAIAPDMLGRVFEGVMEPGRRKASGTFYTPAALVSDLVDAALAALVSARLGGSDEDAAGRIARGDPGALAVLSGATLLDPACGSGAFLLGALDRLATIRMAAGESATAARRRVLGSQLFGVDLDGMAVRLAELRLWLAVVSDDDTADPRSVRPLPNLDALIRQGNSLHQPDGARVTCAAQLAQKVGEVRRRLVGAAGEAKRGLTAELRRLEQEAALESALESERIAASRLDELLECLRAPTLFGDRPRLSADSRRQISSLRRRLRAARSTRRALESGGDVPWFQYESHFPDVMARGGFDVVVGNPPWVRAEELPAAERDRLADRYRWWRGERGPGFRHRPDLAVAFIERAHELAAPGGAVALLVPSKIASAAYAATARSGLVRETTIHAAADLTGESRARFGATVYPMAVITSRRTAPQNHAVRATLEPGPGGIPQSQLGSGPWVIGRQDAGALAARIQREHPAFGSRLACRLGVKTGANEVFLDPDEVERELLRPAVRGRDVGPFRAAAGGRILWTHDSLGAPLPKLPPLAAAHLSRHEAMLRSRRDYAGGPYWTLFRTAGSLSPHRVIWADLARTLMAAVPEPGAVALNTCYVTAAPGVAAAHSVAAWLNSTWLRALARLMAAPAANGYARFSAGVVSRLPAYPDSAALADLGESAAQGHQIQEQLDACVADLLGLDAADRTCLAAVAGAGPDSGR